jgi:hypothetical protein
MGLGVAFGREALPWSEESCPNAAPLQPCDRLIPNDQIQWQPPQTPQPSGVEYNSSQVILSENHDYSSYLANL